MCIRWKTAGRVAGFLLCVILLVSLCRSQADASAGAVTSIGSAEDLLAFAESVNEGESYAGRTVTVTADINMAGRAFKPIGRPDKGLSYIFQGTFDGGGHAIAGLRLDAGDGASAGLFAELYNATVRSLSLDVSAAANGPTAVGGLAGWMVNGTVQNVLVNGQITAARWSSPEDGAAGAGIIAGKATGRTVMDRVAARGSVGGAGAFRWAVYVGGFIGYVQGGGAITNCYTTAGVYVNDAGIYTGGFFGGAVSPPTVKDSYAAAQIAAGRATTGAFAGYYSGGTGAVNTWYDGDLAGDLPGAAVPAGCALNGALRQEQTRLMQDSVFPSRLSEAFTQAAPGQNRGYPVFLFENPQPAPTEGPAPTEPPTPTPEPAVPTETPAPPTEPPPAPTSEPTADLVPTPVPIGTPAAPTEAPAAETPAARTVYVYGGGSGGGGASGGGNAPRTGDDAPLLPCLAGLVLCLAALAGIIQRRGPF